MPQDLLSVAVSNRQDDFVTANPPKTWLRKSQLQETWAVGEALLLLEVQLGRCKLVVLSLASTASALQS